MATDVIVVAYLDAQNRQMRIQYLDPTTGDVLPNLPQIRLDARDLVNATQIDEEHAIEMVCRLLHFTSSIDGSLKRCWISSTIPESDATPLESASEVEDLYLGGGVGGGPTQMQIVASAGVCYVQDATHGDYIWCEPLGGGDAVKVLVEPQLQSSITSKALPDGTTWNYGTYAAAAQSRMATRSDSAITMVQYITPPFVAGDIVPVSPQVPAISGANGTQVAYTGRQWAAP